MVRFEQFRHALGQIVGEDDLQTPLPVRIFVFKNAKGWTSAAPHHARAATATPSCSARRAR